MTVKSKDVPIEPCCEMFLYLYETGIIFVGIDGRFFMKQFKEKENALDISNVLNYCNNCGQRWNHYIY